TEIRSRTGAYIIGLIRKSGITETDLSPDTRIFSGDLLIVLGKAEQLQTLEKILIQG
ncbi:MAG: TrkA C-terminal domain-containing protein, partial [Anaerolineales bacterium]|nr:TrkA C-terminal domain-containing protein [Anaerolineales bacterium]